MTTIIQKLRWNLYGRNARINAIIADIGRGRLDSRFEQLNHQQKTA